MARNHIAALIVGLTVLAVALTGAMAVSGAVGADSHDESPTEQQISVDALGQADAEPDKAIVEAAVRVEGEDPETIRNELASSSTALQDALDAENIAYQTKDYEIREPYRSGSEEPDVIGLHVFEITVDDPDNTGEVVEIATQAGAKIGSIDMTLSDETREELRDQAIQNAMDDASHQAGTIADTSDLAVEEVVSVDATQQRFSPVTLEAAPAGEDDAAGRPTDIETGDVSVVYNVEVTFGVTA